MNNKHLFPTLTLHFIITIFFFLIVFPLSHCYDDEDLFSICSSPYRYRCGTRVLNISYPFWGEDRPQYCGHEGFKIECDQNNDYHFIDFRTQKFGVLNIDASRSVMTIARDDLWYHYCPGIVTEHTVIDSSLFQYTPNVRNVSFFHDCDEKLPPDRPNIFNCTVQGEAKVGFYTVKGHEQELQLSNLTNTCKAEIQVPVLLSALNDLVRPVSLQELLNKGFEVKYMAEDKLCAACNSSGGTCGSDPSASSAPFRCFCRDHDEPQKIICTPPPTGPPPLPGPPPLAAGETNRNLGAKLLVGLVSAIGGLTIIFIVICIFKWKKNSSIITTVTFWKKTKNDRDLEAFIRNYGSLAPKRYSFLNVKKITNSFKKKLGQGGYGGVYKGKLQDGQLVAVKLLNKSKGNGQEFINEVASISKTSHVNVVRLLGFCLEGSKRALIYEFMPNGSLEKFIHNTSTSTLKTNQHLGWEKLYQIALGIARGLEYLHRGCSTRILHFDIKPHNILLDEDFCPKIADFGLAKLCPKKGSNVSLLEARGTTGYVAPEIFIRNFGEVSHKSDVYSYGMMILEMVGGRKNLHLGVENSSEIYFPKWIFKHLDLHEEIKLQDSMTSEEDEIAKKMIIVGLWCIQTLPPDRPSMNKVIDMLQGSIEALQIPPDPFHSDSPRPTLIDSSTISIS